MLKDEALDTDDETVDASSDPDANMMPDKELLMGTLCEDWVASLTGKIEHLLDFS